MTDDDFKHAKAAVEAARNSRAEDGRPHPRVGVVVVTADGTVTSAFRGELSAGAHAEYTALEEKLSDAELAGATVYTTLEPCTTRNHPKIACASRLIERKVRRVVVGMLDPNPNILGRGILQLREAGIEVELFPHALMNELDELNRTFRRAHPLPKAVTEDLLGALTRYSLDGWYELLNSIYWNRNYQRDAASIFSHLVEVVGGLSVLVSRKRDFESTPESLSPMLAKSLAWWFALCGKLGVKSVERILWAKYPRVCPYCKSAPHSNDCSVLKDKGRRPDWPALEQLAKDGFANKPKTVAEWQQMFAVIYPADPNVEEYSKVFAKLAEEMGELAEAVRVFSERPTYFMSEAADVFAWLMAINNIAERKYELAIRGKLLQSHLASAYPARCRDCNAALCACPPVLSTTIGRIAQEVPPEYASHDAAGNFLTPDKRSTSFGNSARGI